MLFCTFYIVLLDPRLQPLLSNSDLSSALDHIVAWSSPMEFSISYSREFIRATVGGECASHFAHLESNAHNLSLNTHVYRCSSSDLFLLHKHLVLKIFSVPLSV